MVRRPLWLLEQGAAFGGLHSGSSGLGAPGSLSLMSRAQLDEGQLVWAGACEEEKGYHAQGSGG